MKLTNSSEQTTPLDEARYVPAGINRVQSALDSMPRHGLDCRDSGLELVVPAVSKSLWRQSHIDVGFDTLAFDYRAAPCVPAGGWEPQHESMADRKVAAAQHLTACARSEDHQRSTYAH